MLSEKKFSLKLTNENLLLFQYSFLILLFITFAYIFRDMEIVQSIRTTMDRLIMTASGFLVYPCIKITLSYFRYKKVIK